MKSLCGLGDKGARRRRRIIMKQCLVMQHVAFEDLGTFAPVLEEKGFAIRYCPVDEPPTEEE